MCYMIESSEVQCSCLIFLILIFLSQAEFKTQPLWRKIQKKKSLNLF